MDEATYKYNCHSYAWHTSEGGSQVWVDSPNDDDYWEDCSYVEVTNQEDATKVSYGGPCYQTWTTCNGTSYTNPCDHSAVTTSTIDYFISKWGASPLFRHHKDDCPYSTEDLHYYGIMSIAGSSVICSSGSVFSVSNLPSVDSIIWETGSRLTVSSGQNTNSCTISATGSGSSWVSARLVTDCGSITLPHKTVWVGAPDLDNITVYYTDDLNQYGEYCPGETNELLARPDPSIDMGITDNYWDLGNWNVYDEDGEGYVLFGIPTSYSGSEELSYEISNSCDVAIGTITLYEGNCGGYYMLISPNPGSGETTISLSLPDNDGGILKSASTQPTFDENTQWDLEIYDSMQSLKLKKQKLKGNSTSINTQSWKEGVYMVRLKYNDELLTGKLVVKK